MKVNTHRTLIAGTALAVLLTITLGNLALTSSAPAGETVPKTASSPPYQEPYQGALDPSGNGDLAPFEEPLYEIVAREADGTTVVQVEFVFDDVATRIRTLVRDGKSIEQVYNLVTPVTEIVTIHVPPGNDILEYVDELYSPGVEVVEPAGDATEENQASGQFEELLFEIVGRQADGTILVQLEHVSFQAQTRTWELLRDGKSIQQFHVISVPRTRVITVPVPPGNDIFAFLIDNPATRLALQQRVDGINRQMEPDEEVYEIIGQQPDGTTLVRTEHLSFRAERRTREVVRDGRTVEQVYDLVIPERQFQTMELPPGKDIFAFLHDLHAAPQAFDAVPATPAAPADDEVPFPPAPIVDPGA